MQNYRTSTRQSRIYLDHNATTPLSELMHERWSDLFHVFGNPSSIHQDSRLPKAFLREARQKLAQYLKVSPLEIVFNSGASEGNNTVLTSVWNYFKNEKPEMLVSTVEHPSVIKTAEYLKTLGAIVHWIPVDRSSHIDLKFIEDNLSSKTCLVSVMLANNETGSLFPLQKISQLARQAGALIHSDCVQMLGKYHCDFSQLNLDYATFSAHKFYALKGTGAVYIKKNSPWTPLIHGGGQERGRRGGTENVLGVASLSIALDLLTQVEVKIQTMTQLRDLMETEILKSIKGVQITAADSLRISNTSSLVIDGVDGETLLMSLDMKGFSVSTGAACSSGNPEPSPVLMALGLSRAEAQSSMRVSLGWQTTEEQIFDFIDELKFTVDKLRKIKSEYKGANDVGR